MTRASKKTLSTKAQTSKRHRVGKKESLSKKIAVRSKKSEDFGLTLDSSRDIPKAENQIRKALNIDGEIADDIKVSLFDKSSIWFLFIFVFLLLGMAALGFVYLRDKRVDSNIRVSSQVTEETVTTVSPIPTQRPEPNLSDYKSQVLNGSGVAGAAKEVSDALEEKGFEKIDTGDANSYNYIDTEVSLKEDVSPDLFEVLKSILEQYNLKEVKSLEDAKEYDIVIIVGSKK